MRRGSDKSIGAVRKVSLCPGVCPGAAKLFLHRETFFGYPKNFFEKSERICISESYTI